MGTTRTDLVRAARRDARRTTASAGAAAGPLQRVLDEARARRLRHVRRALTTADTPPPRASR